MGHHIDTRYAFNDRLLFPDTATFQRIDCTTRTTTTLRLPSGRWSTSRTPCTKTTPFGRPLLRAVGQAGEGAEALNTPKLGDSLLNKTDGTGTPWMADLMRMAPALNWDDLSQRPALPPGQLA